MTSAATASKGFEPQRSVPIPNRSGVTTGALDMDSAAAIFSKSVPTFFGSLPGPQAEEVGMAPLLLPEPSLPSSGAEDFSMHMSKNNPEPVMSNDTPSLDKSIDKIATSCPPHLHFAGRPRVSSISGISQKGKPYRQSVTSPADVNAYLSTPHDGTPTMFSFLRSTAHKDVNENLSTSFAAMNTREDTRLVPEDVQMRSHSNSMSDDQMFEIED